jgi:hypothetical protein
MVSRATPGAGGVSGSISEKKVSNSLVGKGGTWGDRGSPKMSWGRGSPSKAKSGCDPCTIRTDIDNKMPRILTIYQSAAVAESIRESPKPVKLDSGAILVCSNVVILEREEPKHVKVKSVGELESFKKCSFYIFVPKTGPDALSRFWDRAT